MHYKVIVERIVTGGKGLARNTDGQVVMADFVLPREVVVLRETIKKSSYIEAELVDIISPSAERRVPACPSYRQCGGCNLQHTGYDEQLRIKKDIVEETMQRAGVPLHAAGIAQPLPSPQQWGYRFRLRFKIDPHGRLGFFKKRSKQFVPISNCPVASEGINVVLATWGDDACLGRLSEICRDAELFQSPIDGQVTLVLSLNKGRQGLPVKTIKALADCNRIDHLGCISERRFRYLPFRNRSAEQEEPLAQSIILPGQHCTLSWSGGCFSQVNPGQNEQMIRLICGLAGDQLQGKMVLDLYCGMGNFSIPLALHGGTVTGIEGNPESIRWAKINAKSAGMTTAFFVVDDVRTCLQQLVRERQQADVVLLDPPRTGVGKAIVLLSDLRPEKIIYVSCDPATLARDLCLLCAGGYKIVQFIPLDMFPQTSHIETVVLLEKK